MPPRQSKTDSRSLTILFKKHKTTVLLMLQPHESLDFAKERLLDALQSREITNINGDVLPDDSCDIEFGEPVDRADAQKGWKRLQADAPEIDTEDVPKRNKGKSPKNSASIMEAGLQNGHSIAFRFHKSSEGQNGGLDMDLDGEDPGWDVVMPVYEDEPEERV
ncbi:hypothetical protein N7489_006447 [Penicillium chrysogenum]|uniref:Uncharacterized protein n=1 Tax=Penicillium chrysogenum TaxID=5076 RepID=A0ABQ8W3K4_PENCH|nr:uncharacterized protein N7489_006447 [Penicillium chrysogenum]KAJ5236356.1 hypothetical protein N7489_006447 [Penicillium chrysogenum]KAJ5255260.1 hypothetical protein N7505_010411 [Penicillium chrysogenum]KAJ5276295.1 hypothetical protein N7524_002448 [Penicillium chrysogenum]KAJ6152939.1 hypothetical protein N7497_007258 [Penicillium chrysogenum]